MKWRSCIAPLLLAAACSSEPPAPRASASQTALELTQGSVVGFVAESGAHVWRGLPYAASTAGEGRWRAPKPPQSWEGTREALAFSDRCAQLTNEYDEEEGLEPGLVIGSEDCLALDVYAPGDAERRGLPVMVWIHGGGNVWGRSSQYDGSRLAQNEKLLVVAVQYRLGPLGWFSHEMLRSSAHRPEEAAAAFATLDLIASLEWVRENISAFGGDPQNVTIAGESAGGHNVVTLLASSLARGLFHRAIVQSGSFDSVSIAEAEGTEGNLANPSNRVVEELDVESAEALRRVSLEELFAAYRFEGGFLDVPRAIQDGVALPVGPLRDAFSSTGSFSAVPLLLGTTRDEMKLFYFGDDRLTKKRLGFLVVARDQAFYDAFTDYITRLWRIRSVDEPAAMVTRAGHEAVYSYRFDWDDGGRFLFMDFGKLLGAAHGFELPFLFNRFEHLGDADAILFRNATLGERERLSCAIGGLWASFARDGVPSRVGAPPWRVYGTDGTFMRLDSESDGGIELATGSDDLDALLADLRNDGRIDAAQRCFIVEEMEEWMFSRQIRALLRAATGCGPR